MLQRVVRAAADHLAGQLLSHACVNNARWTAGGEHVAVLIEDEFGRDDLDLAR